MGTKNNPGKFNCYENAAPDEPMFVLLARDPLAPGLVRLWRDIRAGDHLGAIQGAVNLVIDKGLKYSVEPEKREKLFEAHECADNMEFWHSTEDR